MNQVNISNLVYDNTYDFAYFDSNTCNSKWGIDFSELPIESQKNIKNFILLEGVSGLSLLNRAYKNYGLEFLSVFSYYCNDLEIWKKILAICQNDGAWEELKKYTSILWLQYKIDPTTEDSSLFFESLINRIKVAIDSTLEVGGDSIENNGARYKKTRFMRSCFSKVRAGGIINMDEFNKNDLWYHMYSLKWGDIINNSSISEMFDPGNYVNSRLFSEKDWSIIYDSILKAYPWFDRSLCFKIIKSFSASLASSSSEFYILRRWKEFMWTMSLDTREKDCLYVWNFYVNPNHCFWTWALLEHVVLNCAKGFKLKATSVLNDLASFRHIEKSIGIGTGITYEVYWEAVSNPILLLEYDNYDFESRKIGKMDFLERCKNNVKDNLMHFISFDKQYSEDYCNEFFRDWYCLTRWMMNQDEVYAWFEKKL